MSDTPDPKKEFKEMEANDRRYRWLTHRVKGARYPSGTACFALPDVNPIGNIFKGSVAQHFDAAIDSAMEKKS